jgi:hypothetical protein
MLNKSGITVGIKLIRLERNSLAQNLAKPPLAIVSPAAFWLCFGLFLFTLLQF